MRLGEAGERRIVDAIRRSVRKKPGMIADFDNDSAIFSLGRGRYAVTTDMGHAGTHFLTEDPVKMGRKIVTSNATDLLSSGAVPAFMLISLGMPESYGLGFVRKLYRSMDSELERYGAHVIGGDTNKTPSFVYSVTMIGKVIRPLTRGGARTGDSIVLTGQVGNAAAGYVALKRKLPADQAFIRAQLEPEIDLGLCRSIIPRASAGIDVSDGLAFELNEMARLSGKRITIDWDRLPVHPAMAGFCSRNGLDMRKMVLGHGEDYQIAYAVPWSGKGTAIGRVEEGRGVFLVSNGKRERLPPEGYEHFRSN
jgi:thiamine-monophosphate kinase